MASKKVDMFPGCVMHSPEMTMPLRGLEWHDDYKIECERVRGEVEKAARVAAKNAYELAKSTLTSSVLPACDSPIERMMAAALYAALLEKEFDYPFVSGSDSDWEKPNPTLEEWARWKCIRTHGHYGIFTFMQAPIGSYRADFLLAGMTRSDGRIHWLVVECDGHEFHSLTKEQVARDRARDRHMTERGYSIMRFTGSEVWKDASACAEQAIEFLDNQMLSESLENQP